jgi:hypothetical protein
VVFFSILMSFSHDTPRSRSSEMEDAPAPTPAPTNADKMQTNADSNPKSAELETSIEEDLVLGTETKVYPLNKNLPAALRQKILDENADFYAQGTWIIDFDNEQVKFNMADVFELRGADVNKRMLPDVLDSGRRLKTIVSLSSGTVGKHLELSLQDALSRDEDTPPNQQKGNQKGKQKGNQKSDQKGKGKGPQKTAGVEAPLDECVKVKFHTDTQAPNIEVSTLDTDTGKVISTRIFADEFAYSPGPKYNSFQVEDVSKEAANTFTSDDDEITHVCKMASFEKTTVIQVKIKLDNPKPDRVWEGILDSSLASIRANPTDSVRDKLITGLDEEIEVVFFFSCKRTVGAVTKWETKFKNYFATLLMLAKGLGNFWFYRTQCMAAGVAGGEFAIDRIEIPKVNFLIPRWLVNEWQVKETTAPDGEVSYSDLKPYSWASLEFPTNYHNANEAAFLLKMSVLEETSRQQRNLRELLQSAEEGKWFKAKFTALDRKKRHYSVEIYLGIRDRMEDLNIKLPAAGTRIIVEVDHNGHESSDEADLVTLKGRVIDGESDATIVCVSELVGSPLQCANNGTDYPVSISYIVDDLPYRRQLQAIMEVQSIREKGEGPDLKAIVLGCRERAKNTDILKQRTTPEQLKIFTDVISFPTSRPCCRFRLRCTPANPSPVRRLSLAHPAAERL